MKKLIYFIILSKVFSQQLNFDGVINNFDSASPDTNYWTYFDGDSAHFETPGADHNYGFINVSHSPQNSLEGSGAMVVDYSVYQNQGWGGFSKIEHRYPLVGLNQTYNWSLYDSLSLSYNNISAQSLPGRVEFRICLAEFGQVDESDTSYNGQGQYWYSFYHILDDEPGWNTVTVALDGVVDAVQSQDGQFHWTQWVAGPGDENLDNHAIKGYSFEFSINGDGVLNEDYSQGTIMFDDFKLISSRNLVTNNTDFEGGNDGDGIPNGWGAWQSGCCPGEGGDNTYISTVMNGDNHVLEMGINDGNGYAVTFPSNTIPASPGETFQLSAFIRDVSASDTGGYFAALKIEAKDANGDVIASSEIMDTTLSSEFSDFIIHMPMPENTAFVTPVLVATKFLNDGIPAVYQYDDVAIISLGFLDTEPPIAVSNVDAATPAFYNLVTWNDNAGENGETYNVYVSPEPISDITSLLVDNVVQGALESSVDQGANSTPHRLFYPLVDTDVSRYYAVQCVDAFGNIGPVTSMIDPVVNTAKGVPTISLSGPTDFVADGDLSEWFSSDIQPFFLSTVQNSYGWTSVSLTIDNDNDLSANVYVAIDQDNLYVAADVIDDSYNGYGGSGNWYEYDALEFFIGLYDQRGAVHSTALRGDEPDYVFKFHELGIWNGSDGDNLLYQNNSENYYFEGFDPDWAFEAKIPLDLIRVENDVRFFAENGFRILFEPVIHDNDNGSVREGILALNQNNNDQAWQGPLYWSTTWLGTRSDPLSVIPPKDINPTEFSLKSNYPNPFNPQTTIGFNIPSSGYVNLSVYNLRGQIIDQLINKALDQGFYEVKWNADYLSSGVYIYKLNMGGKTLTQKMILMK